MIADGSILIGDFSDWRFLSGDKELGRFLRCDRLPSVRNLFPKCADIIVFVLAH